MLRVFILTEEGKSFSKSGLRIIANDLEYMFNETNELVFEQGSAINDKKLLVELLQNNMNSYIVLSTDVSIDYLPPECFDDVLSTLKEDNNKTSWQALCDRLAEERKLKHT